MSNIGGVMQSTVAHANFLSLTLLGGHDMQEKE